MNATTGGGGREGIASGRRAAASSIKLRCAARSAYRRVSIERDGERASASGHFARHSDRYPNENENGFGLILERSLVVIAV